MPMIDAKGGVPGTLPQIRIELESGFAPGYLYELICEAEGSIVQGVGFASVRDLIAFLRRDDTARNPLRKSDGKPAIDRALAFGVSQSGRFLRHFLYLGFDEDEAGRVVFDGLMPHVAGGGLGFFNHRFAQPTRHNAQHDEHLYPTDVFPFTYGPTTDPFTQRTEGILDRYAKGKVQPKVMHTQTSAEYWHRSGSLVHTTPDGKADAEIPANVRIYAFGGCQHGPGDGQIPETRFSNFRILVDAKKLAAFGMRRADVLDAVNEQEHVADMDRLAQIIVKTTADGLRIRLRDVAAVEYVPGICENPTNPADYRPFLRALIVALNEWVKEGKEPPVSIYPKIADGTLVDWHQDKTGFPKIPGVRYPMVIQQPPFADYGPKFHTHGAISVEPPEVKGHYTVLVPKWSDKTGNDVGTALPLDVLLGMATHTGWNTRRESAGTPGMLASLLGSCIPLARTKAARQRSGDPRPSVEERYGSFAEYTKAYRFALDFDQERGWLLAEDAAVFLRNLETRRKYFPAAEGK